MTDVQQEIEQLFRDYEDIWNSQDLARLKELWDEDDPNPFYLAEEQDDWKFGWEAVEKYWVPNPNKSMLDSMMMGYRDFRVKQIGPDLAICACWVRHDMKLKGPQKADRRRRPRHGRVPQKARGLAIHRLYGRADVAGAVHDEALRDERVASVRSVQCQGSGREAAQSGRR